MYNTLSYISLSVQVLNPELSKTNPLSLSCLCDPRYMHDFVRFRLSSHPQHALYPQSRMTDCSLALKFITWAWQNKV